MRIKPVSLFIDVDAIKSYGREANTSLFSLYDIGNIKHQKNIENEKINNFGTSFGIDLLPGSFFSNTNLKNEVGKRDTTNNNLLLENFINFQLSLSLDNR